jgi:hypothetical protein
MFSQKLKVLFLAGTPLVSLIAPFRFDPEQAAAHVG